MSKYTQNLSFSLDLVYISPSKRTTETAQYFIENWKIDKNIYQENELLYDFSGEQLTEVVKGLPDFNDCVMIFGHNFALTSFVNAYGSVLIDNMPTTGFIVLQFNTDSWSNLDQGKTVYTIFPKELK